MPKSRWKQLFWGILALYTAGLALFILLRQTAGNRLWWFNLSRNFTPVVYATLIITLPITLLLRFRALASIQLFGAGLALRQFAPRFLPKQPAITSTDTLKIITFNVYPYNKELDKVSEWLREMQADVVLLQETNVGVNDVAFDCLRDVYPHQVIQNVPEGNMCLSKYPFKVDEIVLSQDWHTQQRIRLTWHGQDIAIYNIHLIMPADGEPRWRPPLIPDFVLSYDEKSRDAQVRQLINIVQHEPYPHIVVGDFNMTDQAVIYEELREKLVDGFAEAGRGMGFTWPSGESEEIGNFLPPIMRLDYVWHSQEWQVQSIKAGPKLGSDHLPLIAELSC